MASYFRADPNNPEEYSPGAKVLLALGGLVGVWGVTSVVYKYFSRPSKPISKGKTIAILHDILTQWSGALRNMAAQEQQLASRPGISQAEMQMIAMYMQSQLQDHFARSEEHVLTSNRVTKRQMKQACEEYKDDNEVSSRVEQIKQLIRMCNPPTHNIPADMTLEKATMHVKKILDMTIDVMEEVFTALGGQNLAKNVIVSPEFIKQLNQAYAKVFVNRRSVYYEENDLTEEVVAGMTEVYSNEPSFREMLAQHHIEKRDAYNRMGLMMPM